MMTRTRSSESSASSSSSSDPGVMSSCFDLAETVWIRPTTTWKSSMEASDRLSVLVMDCLDNLREQVCPALVATVTGLDLRGNPKVGRVHPWQEEGPRCKRCR